MHTTQKDEDNGHERRQREDQSRRVSETPRYLAHGPRNDLLADGLARIREAYTKLETTRVLKV